MVQDLFSKATCKFPQPYLLNRVYSRMASHLGLRYMDVSSTALWAAVIPAQPATFAGLQNGAPGGISTRGSLLGRQMP